MEKWPNYFNYHKIRSFIISDRRQSKTLWTIDERGSQISRNRSLEIVICRQSGDKRQSKTLFLTILDLRSSIVLTFSIAAYLKYLLNIGLLNTQPNQSKTMATRNNLLSGYKRQSKALFLTILDLRLSIV